MPLQRRLCPFTATTLLLAFGACATPANRKDPSVWQDVERASQSTDVTITYTPKQDVIYDADAPDSVPLQRDVVGRGLHKTTDRLTWIEREAPTPNEALISQIHEFEFRRPGSTKYGMYRGALVGGLVGLGLWAALVVGGGSPRDRPSTWKGGAKAALFGLGVVAPVLLIGGGLGAVRGKHTTYVLHD